MVIPVLVWSKAKTKLSELQRQKPTVHPLEKEIEEGNHVAYMSEDESKKMLSQEDKKESLNLLNCNNLDQIPKMTK